MRQKIKNISGNRRSVNSTGTSSGYTLGNTLFGRKGDITLFIILLGVFIAFGIMVLKLNNLDERVGDMGETTIKIINTFEATERLFFYMDSSVEIAARKAETQTIESAGYLEETFKGRIQNPGCGTIVYPIIDADKKLDDCFPNYPQTFKTVFTREMNGLLLKYDPFEIKIDELDTTIAKDNSGLNIWVRSVKDMDLPIFAYIESYYRAADKTRQGNNDPNKMIANSNGYWAARKYLILTSFAREEQDTATTIVIHDTETESVDDTYQELQTGLRNYHYVIDKDGKIYQFTSEDRYVRNADCTTTASKTCAVENIDKQAISIALINSKPHAHLDKQIDSLKRLIAEISSRNRDIEIKNETVLFNNEVDTGRTDPSSDLTSQKKKILKEAQDIKDGLVVAPPPCTGELCKGTGKILLIGDSHTVGFYGKSLLAKMQDKYGKESIIIAGSCSATASNFVTGAAPNVCTYFNDGTTVKEAKDASFRMSEMMSKYNPDVVIISLGTNYINGGSVKGAGSSISDLIAAIGNKKCFWIGAPSSSDTIRPDIKPAEINQALQTLIAGRCEFIDSVPLTDPIKLDSGGVYYTQAGGEEWAGKVFDDLSRKITLTTAPPVTGKVTAVPVTGLAAAAQSNADLSRISEKSSDIFSDKSSSSTGKVIEVPTTGMAAGIPSGVDLSKCFHNIRTTVYYTPFLADYGGIWSTGATCGTSSNCCHNQKSFFDAVRCQGSGSANGVIYTYNKISPAGAPESTPLEGYKNGITAMGTDPMPGRTIAAKCDARFKRGAKLYIYWGDDSSKNGYYIVEDTGSALSCDHIDVYSGAGMKAKDEFMSQIKDYGTVCVLDSNFQMPNPDFSTTSEYVDSELGTFTARYAHQIKIYNMTKLFDNTRTFFDRTITNCKDKKDQDKETCITEQIASAKQNLDLNVKICDKDVTDDFVTVKDYQARTSNMVTLDKTGALLVTITDVHSRNQGLADPTQTNPAQSNTQYTPGQEMTLKDMLDDPNATITVKDETGEIKIKVIAGAALWTDYENPNSELYKTNVLLAKDDLVLLKVKYDETTKSAYVSAFADVSPNPTEVAYQEQVKIARTFADCATDGKSCLCTTAATRVLKTIEIANESITDSTTNPGNEVKIDTMFNITGIVPYVTVDTTKPEVFTVNKNTVIAAPGKDLKPCVPTQTHRFICSTLIGDEDLGTLKYALKI